MINKIMGAEQADGLIIQGNNPTPNGVPTSENEHMQNEMNNNVISTSENTNQTTTTQYYYERNEIKSTNIKKDEKENTNEEPDSTTIFGKRVIQMNKPATIYEKRVISKTIKKEGNNMHINTTNNTTTKTQIQTQIQTKTETQTQTQTKIIKTENYTNDVDNNNELNANQKEIDEDSPDVQIINIEITKKEKKTEKDNKQDNEKEKDKDKEIIITSDNKTTEDANCNKINNINNSIKKKNIMPYVNPSVKIMHRNIIASKNFKQKNYLPKINIDLSKSSNYFTPITPKIIDTNKSVENISFGSKNKIIPSTNNYLTNKLHLKKIEMPTNSSSQRAHSPDVNSIRRKTINRGDEIKNVQITHIICTNKNKKTDFHITEKLSTQNIKSTPLNISTNDREKLKRGGKSTYTSSCTEYRPKTTITQNLKGKTTVYQHARGIGMTNDRRNSNSHCYTSEIKTFEPITTKEKVKLEHVENFRCTKYRNCNSNTNTIEARNRTNIKIKIGNETNNKEKNVIKINNENINSNNGNIIVNEGQN